MSNEPVNYKFFFDLRRDIDAVQEELKSLRATVQNLREFVLDFEKDHRALTQDTTERIKLLNAATSVMQDQIAPIEEMIFPAVSEARRQLARIIDDPARDRPEERPPT